MQFVNDYETPQLVTIRQFGNMSEALAAQGCLSSAGIESYLADANMGRVDWPLTRGMRLQVVADEAESAVEILKKASADFLKPELL
jgi:hypothetical protein